MQIALLSASAGISSFESPAAEFAQSELILDDILIERKSSTFLARASGRSMEWVGIYDRDILVIDRAAPKGKTDVIVAVLNGQFICKLLERQTGILYSCQHGWPQPKPFKISPDDDYLEEGIVIRSIRLHREPALLAGAGL
jgi:DNA polymerase V